MKRKRIRRGLVLLIVAVLVIAGVWYVGDYYHAEENVSQYFQKESIVHVEEIKQGLWLDGGGEETALIFYPGAKVEYTAYLPMLYALAEEGVDVFLVHMPCNLAIFGKNKADAIMSEYTYENWYLGGHSLGGAMAAAYTAKHMEAVAGLALLAAYPTESLSEGNLSVLSVYGSEDHVLSMEKVEEGRTLMPEAYTEFCIKGGNHAQFGNYGLQDGDGEAMISAKEQQEQTVKRILQMIQGTYRN